MAENKKTTGLAGGGRLRATDQLPIRRGPDNFRATPGSAATKDASGPDETALASVAGATVPGDMALFTDAGGTVASGGVPPTGLQTLLAAPIQQDLTSAFYLPVVRAGSIYLPQISALAATNPTPEPEPEVEMNRIAAISTRYGNRPAVVPQGFYDAMAVDAADANTHPHMGPFTHTAVADGLWSNPATWNTGTVPGANAAVNIGSRSVTYDVESDALVKDIHVGGAGTLLWADDRDTRLWVDTIMCHGTLVMGTGENPIGNSTVPGKPRAEIVFHQTEAPLTTTRLGLNTMGPVRIQGARKESRLYGAADIAAGQTSAPLERLGSSQWRVGDKILFLATDNAGKSATDAQYTGPTQFYGPFIGVVAVQTRTLQYRLSHDEVRTITDIIGNTAHFDAPLQFDHVATTGTLPHGDVVTIKPVVANLSRSIRFRSADPSALQKRAHTMFMHHDDVDVRYAEAKNMARTDANPSLVRPDGVLATATNGGTVITDANNVRGRYAFHLHGTGAYFGRNQAVFKGLVAWAPADEMPQPGWAITHHNSRAAIEDCVVYNVRGAGIVSELGNEIGQWVNNTVAWCRGDGFDVSWASRAEQWQNHNGHAGVAYENQARQILQQGNVASSAHFGWFFMQQDVDHLKRIPDKYSMRLYDPITQGAGTLSGVFNQDQDTYGIEQAQIPDFHDNLVLGCGTGFGVAHRQFTDRTDTTPMIAKRFHCVATDTPFSLINYSFFYSFYDFLWDGNGAGAAAVLGNVSSQMMFVNGLVRNYATGFLQSGLGFNYDAFWIDLAFESVATHFTDFTADFNITAWQAANPGKTFPDDHPLVNLMGPWVTDNDLSVPGVRWKGVLRKWEALDSATQLPQPYPAAPRGFGGVEPAAGTPKPYFWLDPTSSTTVTNSRNSTSLKGAIVDSVGVRCWPDEITSESFGPSTTNSRLVKRNENATATDLVLRNGCFSDAGAWKTRLWFAEHDRLTGEYLQFKVDLTLSGLAEDFLLANVVDPAAPALPLLPEAIGIAATPLVIDTTPPVIVTPATATVAENAPLSLVLQAEDGHVKWTVTGGADAALFTLVTAAGVSSVRWLGDAPKNYETPLDGNLDNVYEIEVTATNALGYASSRAIGVRVRDKVEGVVTTFNDNFNRANEDLEISPNWLMAAGEAGRLAVTSNTVTIAKAGALSAYLSPDTGSFDHYVQAVLYGDLVLLGASVTDAQNFVAVARLGGNIALKLCVAGVETTLGTWAGVGNATIRLEYAGGTATVKRNGVTLGVVAVTGGPPATKRVGIIVGTTGPTGTMVDNYAAGAL